jgi:hypothetical protein
VGRYITLDRRKIAKKSKKETMPGLNEADTCRIHITPALQQAGFRDVDIHDEQPFPLDVMGNDPTANAILDTPKVSADDLKSAENAVVSIKVAAFK